MKRIIGYEVSDNSDEYIVIRVADEAGFFIVEHPGEGFSVTLGRQRLIELSEAICELVNEYTED